MNTELIKQDYLNNKKLNDNELLLIFENILDHILRQNTFDNTLKSFYNYRNYKIIKKMFFERGFCITEELETKIQRVYDIELKLIKKESKISLNLGIFCVIFGAVYYILFQNEFGRAPFLFIVSLICLGGILIFRGISNLSK